MTQREQGRDEAKGGEDRDEDKKFKREPRPSDRERDEDEDQDADKDPGARRAERDPGDRDEDEDSDADEGQSAAGADDDVDEETRLKRERRRQEKKDKRERERRERQADKETIRELREKYANLEQRLNRGEVEGRQQRVDDDLVEVDQAIKTLRGMRRKAIENVDADAIDDLDEKLYRARSRKDALLREQEGLKRRPAERVADDALIRHAKGFMREHSWYDPQQNTDDEDSLIVQAIDRRLNREGTFDPNSPTYWDELRDRVKKHPRLKHRFGGRRDTEDDNDVDADRDEDRRSERRGGPPVGGRGNGRGDGVGGFQLTEEHKHALREAGIEPGTKRYAAMIDQFKKKHKEQRDAARAS